MRRSVTHRRTRTCLRGDHEGGVAVVVLVVDVYQRAYVQSGDDVNEALADGHHQPILRGTELWIKVILLLKSLKAKFTISPSR